MIETYTVHHFKHLPTPNFTKGCGNIAWKVSASGDAVGDLNLHLYN